MVGWVVTTQISSLLRELPKYSREHQSKGEIAQEGCLRLEPVHQDACGHQPRAGSRMPTSMDPTSGVKTADRCGSRGGPIGRPTSSSSRKARSGCRGFRHSWPPLMEYLGELALAIVLVIFMLQKREELRNRMIRLAGRGQIVDRHQVCRRGGTADQPVSAEASDCQWSVRADPGAGAFALDRGKVRVALGLPGGDASLPSLYRAVSCRGLSNLAQPGDVRWLGNHAHGGGPVPDPGADCRQRRRALALWPEHGRLGNRPAWSPPHSGRFSGGRLDWSCRVR